jgi:hypothetical protein
MGGAGLLNTNPAPLKVMADKRVVVRVVAALVVLAAVIMVLVVLVVVVPVAVVFTRQDTSSDAMQGMFAERVRRDIAMMKHGVDMN